MELHKYSFEELFSAIGKKMDQNPLIKLVVNTEDPVKPEPEPEDPYEGIEFAEFKTSNRFVVDHLLIGFITEDSIKKPLYIVTFDDNASRGYTLDSKGEFKNRGKNIYNSSYATIVNKSKDWESLVIDSNTGNEGLNPDVYAAKL